MSSGLPEGGGLEGSEGSLVFLALSCCPKNLMVERLLERRRCFSAKGKEKRVFLQK